MKTINTFMTSRRLWPLVLLLLIPVCDIFAAPVEHSITVETGGTNYSYSTQGLAEMLIELSSLMVGVIGLLYAVASILAIYNATVIYIKMNTGEEGFTKSVVMLVGACVYLICATMILPSLFAIDVDYQLPLN